MSAILLHFPVRPRPVLLPTHGSSAVLPLVQACAAPEHEPVPRPQHDPTATRPTPAPRPSLAFYRKYTQALLRRYVRLSLEAGRTPSLLGQQEFFRAKVTHYRVESFEDVVNDLETRDEMQEVQMQTELLKAGVLTVDEVREMRGLPKLTASAS